MDSYKMFLKIQENDKKRKKYINNTKEEIIDELILLEQETGKLQEIKDLINYYDTKMRMDDEIYIDKDFLNEIKFILDIY